MRVVIQHTIDAVSIGSIYAVMALSLALLFGIMRLVNFAFGELIMAGGYTMHFMRDRPWPALIAATIAGCAVLALLMDRVAFRPLRDASVTTLLITSFAVSFMIQSLAGMAFGTLPQGVAPPDSLTRSVSVSGVFFSPLDVITIATVAVLLVGLALVLQRTMLGIHMRAATEDFDMARLCGVRADRIIASAFAITGMLAAVVSLLYFSRYGAVTPTSGLQPVLIAFVGGVIGGLGSLVGAALGGFSLGVLTTVLQSTLPISLAGYTQAFAFVAVILVLLIRPAGIVSAKTRAA